MSFTKKNNKQEKNAFFVHLYFLEISKVQLKTFFDLGWTVIAVIANIRT